MKPVTRAALFDLDGTLVDSAPDIAAALNHALGWAGLAPFNLTSATAMVGAGARTLIDRALTARGRGNDLSLAASVHARFLSFYDANPCVATTVYPGVEAALETLRRDGWALGVVTNKPEPIARAVMDALDLSHTFGVLVGGRDGVPLKPDAAMIHLALDALGADRARAVFIGDSSADVGAARAAGVPVVLLSHGYSDVAAVNLGADAAVDHFAALIDAIMSVTQAPSRQTA